MTEPVRVLQVMASLDRGGAETVVMDWLRHMDRDRVIFDFVVNEGGAYGLEQEAKDLGCRVVRAPKFRGWNTLSYARWWGRFLADHGEWRIIHGHHTVPGFVYLREARRRGRVSIAHSHTAGGGESLPGLMRRVFRWPLRYFSDVLLSCSTEAGEWMFGSRGTSHTIPNGINSERFAFDPAARSQVRNQLGYGEALVIGHVGSFSRPKNHKRILRIFAALAAREPSARLLLVGDGGLRRDIEQAVQSLGLEGRVLLAGVREDIPALLSAMDVLLFPSLYEGLPVSVVEAQAAGLPCVVSDVITREVHLTDLVRFVSLREPDETWCDAVLQAKAGPVRRSRIEELRVAGYDSVQVAKEMQQLYLSRSGYGERCHTHAMRS